MGRYSKHPEILNRLRRVQRLDRHHVGRPAARPVRVHAVTRRLDQATRQQLVDDYTAGEPTTVLMQRYDIGKGTVLGILRRAGVAMRNKGLGPGDLGRAVVLYESGQSCQRVGEQLGCDAETVRQALKAAGVVMRKPWERG